MTEDLDSNQPPATQTKSFVLAAIRDGVIFPHSEVVLTFGRPRSVKAVEHSFLGDRQIVFVTQKHANIADPGREELFDIGVLASIERTLKTNDEINALVRGLQRVKIESVDFSGPYLTATITEIPEVVPDDPQIEAMSKHLLNDFKQAVNLGKSVEFLNFMKLMSGVQAPELVDQVAVALDLPTKEKQQILETTDLIHRFELVIAKLSHEIQILEIEKNITSKTQKKFDKSMRENVLRERMRTIQKELGDESDEEQEIEDFKTKAKKAKFPQDVKAKVDKEINRFAKLSVHSPEYSYIRTWLETVLDMPWNRRSPNNVSIARASKVLSEDHYGLQEVNERIIEYLSVLTLKKQKKNLKDQTVPTIICFVGPPGVGKTSIGRSIAKALNRKFIKVSLGGIRDEAEIRGHRRTYVGAMPGRIIQGIRQNGTRNPVFMLDEIDKVGADFRGDPSSALLEALDPEQNHAFSDHYLEVPFDLSEVIFITTANVLDTIPPALRDRLEIIQFTGYTQEEKFAIATKHLIKKTINANGLTKSQITLKPEALKIIIQNYTREAGVRNLEREISKIMRKTAKKIAAGESTQITIGNKDVSEYLGPIKFTETGAEKQIEPGLATGLAWTQVGGDIIFIEVAVMPGSGRVTLTGKLGQVMQESGKAAWSYVRSRWDKIGIKADFYKKIDIHIHVPEGAVPKDGPSAGVTIATAIISALTKKPVKPNLGMTGEVTLRGRVLEIGGVKEKVIAGHRAGLREIILPKNNQKDLIKVPKSIEKEIKFHFVEHMDQVLKIALKK